MSVFRLIKTLFSFKFWRALFSLKFWRFMLPLLPRLLTNPYEVFSELQAENDAILAEIKADNKKYYEGYMKLEAIHFDKADFLEIEELDGHLFLDGKTPDVDGNFRIKIQRGKHFAQDYGELWLFVWIVHGTFFGEKRIIIDDE